MAGDEVWPRPLGQVGGAGIDAGEVAKCTNDKRSQPKNRVEPVDLARVAADGFDRKGDDRTRFREQGSRSALTGEVGRVFRESAK